MKTAEEWYEDSRRKYLPPKVFGWKGSYEHLPPMKVDALAVIKKLMRTYIILRAGYCATCIRGYHDHVVFYRRNK